MEEILAKEEEHAEDLNSMLQDMGTGLQAAGTGSGR
jgi:bacterioferritin (cytochrome b1)